MKKTTRTPYESPQVEILSIRMDGALLTISNTGESYKTPIDYDLGTDWSWIL